MNENKQNFSKEQQLAQRLKENITVPDIVERKANQAFQTILSESGETRMAKRRIFGKAAVAAAALCILTVTVTTGVLASRGYFEKYFNQTKNSANYTFSLNYDLAPGEFQVKVNYLPEGYVKQEDNKFSTEDNLGHGISILPVISGDDLEKCEELLPKENIDQVEKTVLSGMEAHIITHQEAEKYQSPTNILLFNPGEGYVVQVYGDYSVPVDELKKVADNLVINRIGDKAFKTAKEKEIERQAEKEMTESEKAIVEEMEKRLLTENLIPMKTEGMAPGNEVGYKINGYEYIDSAKELDSSGFYDYSAVKPWLNEDGTLKQYTRQTYSSDGDLLKEEKIDQVFLKVNITAHRYGNSSDLAVPFDAALTYTKALEDGTLTLNDTIYQSVPFENGEEAAKVLNPKRIAQVFIKNCTGFSLLVQFLDMQVI